jgi:hypothetical protein
MLYIRNVPSDIPRNNVSNNAGSAVRWDIFNLVDNKSAKGSAVLDSQNLYITQAKVNKLMLNIFNP